VVREDLGLLHSGLALGCIVWVQLSASP